MKRGFPSVYFILPCLLIISLAGCNLPDMEAAAGPALNVTQAYQTVEARLTQAIGLTPTTTRTSLPVEGGTPTGSGAPSATSSAAPTPAAPTPASPATDPATAPATSAPVAPSATAICDRAAPGTPFDITIPDDTQMRPGQFFTKTWRLSNVGECTWTRDYRAEFFSGEQMNAPASVPLQREVSPGQSIDISVDMVAPTAAGTYQSNWKLRNDSDDWFGIGPSGSSPFWVRIVVIALPTATPTPELATPTATATPAVQFSGPISLVLNDRLDLDNGQVNSGVGEDLLFETNVEGKHLLTPQGSALLAFYAESPPSLANCQAASLGPASLLIEDLPQGAYLCYRTNLGLPGSASISSLDPGTGSLALELLTWSVP